MTLRISGSLLFSFVLGVAFFAVTMPALSVAEEHPAMNSQDDRAGEHWGVLQNALVNRTPC